jgi:copper transport protein
MKRSIARSAILFLLLAVVLLRPSDAAAHANIVSSVPAPGATVATAPPELVLEFSEPLDPGFTQVRLLDSRGATVAPGPGAIDTARPTMLRLTLGPLPQGVYTAIWRARSAVDGHVTEGNVPFGVGVAVAATALIPPPGAPDPALTPPPAFESAARWLALLTAALALGGLPFALFVWRPAFHRALAADERRTTNDDRRKRSASSHWSLVVGRWSAADDQMTRTIRRLVILGGALLIAASLLLLVAQAATAAGVQPWEVFGAPLARLLASRTGTLTLARIGLAAALLLLAWRLPPAGRGAAWPWWLGLALSAGIALTFSLNSHGAALPQGMVLAVAFDWVHVAGMAAWLGGLVPLAFALAAARREPERALPLAMLIPRFSALAISSVIAVALSGLYSYTQQIGDLALLPDTSYGRALLLKTGLFGILLLLGAVNLLVLSPRLWKAGNRLAGAFRRSVGMELLLGASLLLAAGAMTSVAPGKTAWEEKERQGIAQEAAVGDVDLTLRIAPAVIGENEFAVDVRDRRPGAAQAASKVLLRFDMAGMAMGQLQTETQPAGGERYTARGNFVSMGGRWNVEVILRRAGFDDVRHTFQLDVLRSALAEAP